MAYPQNDQATLVTATGSLRATDICRFNQRGRQGPTP